MREIKFRARRIDTGRRPRRRKTKSASASRSHRLDLREPGTLEWRGKAGGMKLEDQVVSLELAKKLKELGVKQESYFTWKRISESGNFTNPDEYEYRVVHIPGYESPTSFSAFTVAELGEMLPSDYFSNPGMKGWTVYSFKKVASPYIYHAEVDRPEPFVDESTEADARAAMLVHLIENRGTSSSAAS